MVVLSAISRFMQTISEKNKIYISCNLKAYIKEVLQESLFTLLSAKTWNSSFCSLHVESELNCITSKDVLNLQNLGF